MRNATVEKKSWVFEKNKGYGIQVRKKGNALHSSTARDSRFQASAGQLLCRINFPNQKVSPFFGGFFG